MLRTQLLLLALVFWPSYSSSESIKPYYGATPNAAANGLSWSMGSVLPTPPGLDIQNVLYSYTIIKENGEAVTVYVQNKLAGSDNEYIFRDREDWSPTSPSGQEVRKVIPVGNLHRDLWGDGEIDVQGNGSVENPSVIYTYRVDPCYNPQFDPNCPGYEVPYVEPPEIDYEIYDAYAEGDAQRDQYRYEDDDELQEEEDEEKRLAELEDEEREREDRLEKAMFEASRAELFALAFARGQMKDSINLNMNSYYDANIPGGTYNDSLVLLDTKLPENQSGLRNGLAQQLLHQQMVDMQYNLSTGQ